MARSGYKTSSFTYEGKRYYCYGKTQREADRKADRKLEELKKGLVTVSPGITVDEWTKKWKATYKTNVSSHWSGCIDHMIEAEISPAIGKKSIASVKPVDIAAIANGLSKYSESYAKKIMFVLGQIFRTAVDNDLIVKSPVRGVKLPVCKANESHRSITMAERELTLHVAYNAPQDGLFFVIMLYCGCRPQEVCALLGKDFDTGNMVLHITKARKSDGTIGEPKSKAGIRDIPIPDALLPWLKDIKPDEYVCTNVYGEPLIKESANRMWKRFKRRMDIENGAKVYRNQIIESTLADDLTPYCYRHTYCTDLQDAGVPLVVASRLMGHSDISLTAKIYTHASKDSFEDAKDRINNLHKKDVSKKEQK